MKISLVSILLFTFSQISAQVTFLQTIKEGQGGIEGIRYPKDITTDSTGREMYIAAYNCITHLQRIQDNAFLFKNSITYSSVNYPGLWNVDEVVLDRKNRFLYATGDHYINIFRVDHEKDSLVFLSGIPDQANLFIGSASMSTMLISPEDSIFYLATKEGFQNALHVFKRDNSTGLLTHKSTTDTIWSGGDDFIDIKCNKSGEFIYVLTYRYNVHAALSIFKKTKDFKLELIQTLGGSDGINEPAKILISFDGRFLYLFGTQKVKIFSVSPEGIIAFLKEIDVPECYKLAASHDDRFVYFGFLDKLIVMERDVNTGDLSTVQEIMPGSPDYTGISYLASISFSKHDSLLYVADTYNHRFHLFSRNQENGKIQFLKEISDMMDKVIGLGDASDLTITHDNQRVLTVCPSGFNSINIFQRDQGGLLNFSKVIKWQELGPEIGATNLLELSPDDRYLYVTSTNMYGIRQLELDITTGIYKYVSNYTYEETGLPVDTYINNVSISHDTAYLYISTFDHLLTYEIGDSGKLKYKTKYGIHENCDNGLRGILSLVQTNDNRYIYLCSNSDFYPRGLTVLKRNADGSVEFVSKNQDVFAQVVLTTDDGRFVYALGNDIYSFSVDPITGELTLIQQFDVESLGFPELYKIEAAIMSVDNKSIICLSRQGKAILSLYRDETTGFVRVIEMKNYSNNMNYSDISPSICMSYDSRNIYLISPGYLSSYSSNIPLGLLNEYFLCKDSMEIAADKGYKYLWSTGDTTRSIYVKPGNYSIQVSDSIGRKGFSSTTVSYYQLPLVLLDLVEPTSVHTWRLIAETVGGEWPYTYLWSDGSTDPWIYLDQADSGKTFSVIVTDNHGCSTSGSLTATIITLLHNGDQPVMTLSPNPVKDKLYISVKGLNQDWFVKIYSLSGELIYSTFHRAGEEHIIVNLDELKPGAFLVEIIQSDQSYIYKIIKE